MTVAIDRAPVRANTEGVFLVGDTRVTLDTLAYEYNSGATAEEIVHRYPSLSLDEVHGGINYYLQNKTEVDRYIERHRAQIEKFRRECEARFDSSDIRKRLTGRMERQNRP